MLNKHLFIHRLCKLIGYRHYYENCYGIKGHNKAIFQLQSKYDEVLINPEDVYLGFDALKDEYTLLGVKMIDSPHYHLMKTIYSGENINGIDYVEREKKGTLDGRYELVPVDHIKLFSESLEKIKNDEYDPAIVYRVDGQIYAFDGKHRLALCLLLHKKCRCICMDLSELRADVNTNKLLCEMEKTKKNLYTKNIEFIKRICNHI